MIFTDQMGNSITLSSLPKKIISLVPSQTELLFDLGLDEEIVGITKYCIHPKDKISPLQRATKGDLTIIGGTKKLKLDLIRQLKPDLIIGNKEENEKGQILELQKEFPVWMSDIKTLDESLDMIEKMGELVGRKEKGVEIKNEIKKRFDEFLLQSSDASHTLTVLYLIWKKPFICAGKNTFINHMLELCGFMNVNQQARYPEISNEEIKKLNPDFIFLSSEPYPFKEKHIAELQNVCPDSKIILVDGEMFSWYGSRLLYAPSYFKHLLLNLPKAV